MCSYCIMLSVDSLLHVGGITDLLSTHACDYLQDGGSPLLASAQEGHLEVVRVLLEGGAGVNQARQVCVYLSLMVRTQVCPLCHELFDLYEMHALYEIRELQPQCSVQVAHCQRHHYLLPCV